MQKKKADRSWRFRIFFLAALTLVAGNATGGFNHPELTWRTIESDHFSVHFYENTEPFALPAIAVAEEVYPALNEIYGFLTHGKINIVLADYDDFTNGFADWLGSGVMIWTPDGPFALRGNTTWLRNVLTHELSHIITMRKTQGMQMLDFGVSATMISPGFAAQAGRTMAAMNMVPNWFAEGLAQIGAFRHQCDCWDNRRDMVLRCAALDGTLLSLDQMGVFAHDQLGNEMVYNQGFSLAMHIEKRVGSDEIKRVLAKGNRPWKPFAQFESPMGSSFGQRDIEFHYRQWRDSLVQEARSALPVQPTPTRILWQNGRIQSQPRGSAKGEYTGWLSSNGDDGHRTDLLIFKKNSAAPLRTIKHAESSWDFSAAGDAVYYVSSYNPGSHGSFFKDLYHCDCATGKERRLTVNGRVYAVAAAPSGNELAVVRFGGDRFSLERYDCASRIFTVIDTGNPGDPFISLDYDPNLGSRLVVERVVRGRSSIYLFDPESRTLTRIGTGIGQEQAPFWAANNRVYFSADYDGIFNIYSILPDGTDLMRHTSVIGGAFEPQVDDEAQTLYFSEYASGGFRIAVAPLSGSSYAVARGRHCAFLPLTPYTGTVSVSRPYGLRMLRPYWESRADLVLDRRYEESGIWALQFGLNRFQTDALDRFSIIAGTGVVVETVTGGATAARHTGRRGEALSVADIEGCRARFNRWNEYVDSSANVPYGAIGRVQRRVMREVPSVGARSEDDRATESSAGSAATLYVMPQLGIVSTALGPTLEFTTHLQTASFFPQFLLTDITLAQQTSRATAAGASFVSILVIPKMMSQAMRDADSASRALDESITIGPAGAAFPLWFGAQDYGYVNEDIGYNLNGLWLARLTLTPSSMLSLIDDIDSIYYSRAVKGIAGRLDLFRGFPVTKYSGIPVSFGAGLHYFQSPVNGTFFDAFNLRGNSDCYLTVSGMAAWHFPLVRKIDAGRRLFFDAWYGKIGYRLVAEANREFLIDVQNRRENRARFIQEAFTVPDAHRGAYVEQRIVGGCTIGTVSEFIFSGGIDLLAEYDVVTGAVGFLVSGMF